MDPAETYRKLNAELIKQVQENKLKQRLFEMKNLQLEQQSIIHQQIIREQKIIIESFVNQNSQDLTVLLAQLVEGQKQNMTVVTDFVQNMLLKLQSLLIHISSDSSARGAAPLTPFVAQRSAATPTQPTTQPTPSAVTVRSVRAHRSLSPVVRGDPEAGQEEGEKETEHSREIAERPTQEMFVTRRRRNNTPRNSEELEDEMDKEQEKQTVEPPCEPFTLPDGMLSTIPETAEKRQQQMEREDEAEEDSGEEEEDEDEENESQDEELVNVDQENISIDKTPSPAIVVAATRRKRMLSSRSVLSPVDPNQVEARVKRTRTPMPRKHAEVGVASTVEEEDDQPQPQDISLTCRPRRKAAPSTLVEPSRRVKMRR